MKQLMVTVEIRQMNRFRCLYDEWIEMGGYRGFLQLYCISIRNIKKVSKELVDIVNYPKIPFEG